MRRRASDRGFHNPGFADTMGDMYWLADRLSSESWATVGRWCVLSPLVVGLATGGDAFFGEGFIGALGGVSLAVSFFGFMLTCWCSMKSSKE